MSINPTIFTWLISRISYIWSYLDNISIGSLGFSFLDLCIVMVLASIILPSVLNLTASGSTISSWSYTRDFEKKGG